MSLPVSPVLEAARVVECLTYVAPTTAKQREFKVCRRESAAEAVGTLRHDYELHIYTRGQFSMIDVIRAILEQTGPAAAVISTWTAAPSDIAEAHAFARDGLMTSTRWLFDTSFYRREPATCGQLRNLFGLDNVRVTKNHAKFMVFTNADWNVVSLTSMNLNMNPRMEHVLIREDRDLAAWNLSWVDDLFRTPRGVQNASDAWSGIRV